MTEMNLRGIIVDYIDIPANPKKGFYFPFKIIIPKNINDNPNLIYACNLTKNVTDKCSTIEELIEKVKDDLGNLCPMSLHLCLANGNPMVVPFVPRLNSFRPNFLGRDCLLNKFNLSENDKKFEKYM